MTSTTTGAPPDATTADRTGAYEVHTPVYEGPFDLLLHLILRDQVDLYEITLTEIVDAYLAELERMETLDLDVATEFLLIAATLVELKSRRLLPGDDDLDLDDELALWEERDLLLARLLECKTFKDASVVLARFAAEAGRSWPRVAGMEERFLSVAPDLLAGVTPDKLRDAFLAAVAPKPQPRIDLEHVAPVRMSVAEAVEELMDELPSMGRITFRTLTQSFVDRVEVIVRFLALLEMFKQGWVDLEQAGNFGELHIAWIGIIGDDEPGGVTARLAAIDDYEGLSVATEATRAIEAILMVADRPVEPHLLAQLLEVSPDRVDELCAELGAAYEAEERGFALVKVAGGYRYQSHPDLAAYVERFVLEGQSSRLSAAALETLAIVAYKQPISRAQVSAIRGVDVDGVMRTLQQRGYIDEIARDAGPGQAVLFGTTEAFLEKMGLYSLEDLPALGEFVPDARVVEALEAGLRPDPLPEVTQAQAAVDPTLAPSVSSPAEAEPAEGAEVPAEGAFGVHAEDGADASSEDESGQADVIAPPGTPEATDDDAGPVDPGAGPRADG